jgi:hypothetical protein
VPEENLLPLFHSLFSPPAPPRWNQEAKKSYGSVVAVCERGGVGQEHRRSRKGTACQDCEESSFPYLARFRRARLLAWVRHIS